MELNKESYNIIRKYIAFVASLSFCDWYHPVQLAFYFSFHTSALSVQRRDQFVDLKCHAGKPGRHWRPKHGKAEKQLHLPHVRLGPRTNWFVAILVVENPVYFYRRIAQILTIGDAEGQLIRI